MDKKRILENANEVLHEVGREVHSEPDSPLGIFKKYSKLSFFWRIMTAFWGQVICGIGVAFMVFANLGVDPASVFTTGLLVRWVSLMVMHFFCPDGSHAHCFLLG